MKTYWKIVLGFLVMIFLIFQYQYMFDAREPDNSDPETDLTDERTVMPFQDERDRMERTLILVEMAAIQQAITMYNTSRDEDPKSIKDLIDAGYISRSALTDSHGSYYKIMRNSQGSMVLVSPGKDRVLNTPDDVEHPVWGVGEKTPVSRPSPTKSLLDLVPLPSQRPVQNP